MSQTTNVNDLFQNAFDDGVLSQQSLQALGVEGERTRFHTIAANEPHRLAHLLAEASESMPAGRIGE